MKTKKIFPVSVTGFLILIPFLLLVSNCKKTNESFKTELLTSRSWSLVKDNNESYGGAEYCVFGFRSDGTVFEYNFKKDYFTWRLKDDDLLILDFDEYKILKLTKDELIIKFNVETGHTYSFYSLPAVYLSTDGVTSI
jgi:hypothetical protein